MRGQSVELAGEVPARTTVESIFRRVEEELRPGESVRFETADGSHIPLKTLQTSLVSSLAALVRNGLQACSGQESVVVEARRAGESIVFSVRDRGEGIAPDVLKRVGSPFFTTKNPGQGLGLGVFLVKLFALQVGGNFSLSSVPGQGSEARLVVPMEVSA
jgi:two-component system sensor histidine kinase RegB